MEYILMSNLKWRNKRSESSSHLSKTEKGHKSTGLQPHDHSQIIGDDLSTQEPSSRVCVDMSVLREGVEKKQRLDREGGERRRRRRRRKETVKERVTGRSDPKSKPDTAERDQVLKVISFNVRSMSNNDTDNDKRVLMSHELKQLGVDIAIFQEARMVGKGKVDMGSGYDLYFSGHGKHKIHGVAIAIRNDMIFKSVNQISERLMELTVETAMGSLWHIIGAYAPTNCSGIEDKLQFYRQITETLARVDPKALLIVGGDFNARLGPYNPLVTKKERVIGRHGIQNQPQNQNGNLLHQLASKFKLVAANTFFESPRNRYGT
jgi:exonuclease III